MLIPADIDWLELWRELTIATSHPNGEPTERFREHAKKWSERPDPLLDFVLKGIESHNTVLDIGAGSGRWTLPIAKTSQGVTAIEPSKAMRGLLRENIASARLNNIQIIESTWEEAVVEPHDIVVCAHAMYSSPDLSVFVHKMEQSARKMCCLAVRLPPADGVIGELSSFIHGCFHDSPNAIIAYNALYSMGIYANLLVEKDISRWVNNTFKDAFARAKRHLHLESRTDYDELIRNTLARRLISSNNSFIWPDGMRSAIIWWSPSSSEERN